MRRADLGSRLVAIDWRTCCQPGERCDLPAYPWQRERHWVREAEPVDARARGAPRNVSSLTTQQRGCMPCVGLSRQRAWRCDRERRLPAVC